MAAIRADPEVSGRGGLAFAAEPAEQALPAEDPGAAAAFANRIIFTRCSRLRNDLASVVVAFGTSHFLFSF